MVGDQNRRDELVAQRSGSFGRVATAYDRYRPGPPPSVIEWMLPEGVSTVVDLGAGTGAMTRELVPRCARVVAVEPDDLMRAVLSEQLTTVEALPGAGESMPLDDSSVDAVLASSSWHWMDATRTLAEVERVLVPGGTLAAVWTGPDPEGPFLEQARVLLSSMAGDGEGPKSDDTRGEGIASDVLDDGNRVEPELDIPTGSPFAPPEQSVVTWDVPLTADDLLGLLGTFSWVITMSDDRRARVMTETRRVLHEGLGMVRDVTVDVQYRCEAWKTHLT